MQRGRIDVTALLLPPVAEKERMVAQGDDLLSKTASQELDNKVGQSEMGATWSLSVSSRRSWATSLKIQSRKAAILSSCSRALG